LERYARRVGPLFVMLLLAVQASAQPANDHGLAEGMRQVDEGEFDNAIVTLDTAARRLARDPARARELSQAYLYLGIAYVGKGHEAAAKAKFREALAQIKDLSLSTDRFPPKVIDLFEAARSDAERARPAPAASAAPAPSPAKKGGGGGKTLLVVGGLAVVGGGVALAGGGGGGGSSGSGSGAGAAPTTTTTATTLPTQGFTQQGAVAAGAEQYFPVTPRRAGTLEATVTWTNRNLRLDLTCLEAAAPYTACPGTYTRTSDTSGRYQAELVQKEYLLGVANYGSTTGSETFTVVVRYP
jgi:hypothetical protein